MLTVAETIFKREYNRIIEALGGIWRITSATNTNCSGLAIPTTTRARRAAKVTWKSPRTSTTRTKTSATWCSA